MRSPLRTGVAIPPEWGLWDETDPGEIVSEPRPRRCLLANAARSSLTLFGGQNISNVIYAPVKR